MFRRGIVTAGSLGALVFLACGHAEIDGTALDGVVDTSSTDPQANGGACEGPAKLEPVDPASLPACCEGAGHCLAKDKVPGKVRRALAECPGGYCVPDLFLRGQTPATCTAFGKPGACASKCIPQVTANATLLQQDTCAGGELCAPCISPLNKQPTGICELGKESAPNDCSGTDAAAPPPTKCPHEGPPVIDPLTLPSCGTVAGSHCLDAKLVAPATASKLAKCDTGLCVPDTLIASGGQFIPATCASLGGAEGRCLHVSLPDVGKQADKLPQATCAARELCAPCFSPIDGADTGVCHVSCDPGPKAPPYVFPSCCTLDGKPRGRCVPSTSVSATERENLSRDVCTSTSDICVPGENLDATFKPAPCTEFSAVYLGNYEGVCLSNCLKFSGLEALAIGRGKCDAIHQCVPCKSPTGTPTGAPGCAP
jgi:hypothetical protein